LKTFKKKSGKCEKFPENFSKNFSESKKKFQDFALFPEIFL